MTRLKEELQKRNIIFEADEKEIYRTGIDESAELVEITDKFIITVFHSNVLPPILYIYDRFTFEPIAEQEMYKDTQTDGGFAWFNPWHSMVYENEEVIEDDYDDYASNAPCDSTGFCAGSGCKYFYQCQC